jgi:hypothetical protein
VWFLHRVVWFQSAMWDWQDPLVAAANPHHLQDCYTSTPSGPSLSMWACCHPLGLGDRLGQQGGSGGSGCGVLAHTGEVAVGTGKLEPFRRLLAVSLSTMQRSRKDRVQLELDCLWHCFK